MGSTKSRRIGLTLVIDWVELDFFSTKSRWVKVKLNKKKKKNQPEPHPPLFLTVQVSVIYSKTQTVAQ